MAEPLLCYGHVHDIYETEARMIGCWIDGKPIYRKVIPFTITAADMQIDTGVADIEQVVRLDGVIKYLNDGFRTIPWAYTQGTTTDVKYYIGAHLRIVTTPDCKIQILSGSYYNGMSGYMILEYTLLTHEPDPDPYQYVEYLLNDNDSSYVEVPYTPTLGDDLHLTYAYVYTAATNNATVFSCGNGGSEWVCIRSSGKQFVKNMTDAGGRDMGSVSTETPYETAMLGNGTCTITDLSTSTTQTFSQSQRTAPSDTSFWLFARKSGSNKGLTAILSVRIVRSGTDVINLRPCYRKSDGANGFYDTVGNVFYAGTGSFTRGADVTE